MTRSEFILEALRTGQPFKVAKANGIHFLRARLWYESGLREQEDSGALGTWSKEEIDEELARLRRLVPPRKEMHGNLTMHAPLRDDENIGAHSILGDGDGLSEEDPWVTPTPEEIGC